MRHTTITEARIDDWMPNAWAEDDHVNVAITSPMSEHKVLLMIPGDLARKWAHAAHDAIVAAADRLDERGP